MQTTSSAMIDDLFAVIGKHKSNFVGFYDTLKDLQDAIPSPTNGLQAIVIKPSEFYYHVVGGSWVKFAPVGEVHPTYVGAYDTLQDLQAAIATPNDGDMAIIGKQRFYIYASNQWEALITSTSGTESAQVTKNTADIAAMTSSVTAARQQADFNRNRLLQIQGALGIMGSQISRLDPRPVFEYRGPDVPTLPNQPQSAYFIDVYAMNQDGQITLPYFPSTPIRSGAVFVLANGDSNNSIRIYGGNGETISGAASINIPPSNFTVIAKTSSGWQILFGGYVASSFRSLMNRIKANMADDLHTTAEVETIINNWLANPTTKANLDTIMQQLGYTKSGSGTGPHPSTVRVHYGINNQYPTDFSGETGEVAPHEEMVISGLNINPRKVWVAVPQEVATKVVGITANNGLVARWQFSKITIGRKTWTVYQSPTKLADSTLNLDIVWRI